MKNNWKKDELGNLIEYCARGVSPSYTEGAGVIVLNQKCIRDNKISLEPSRITDSEKKKISEEKYLKKFDILVNSTGVGTLGRVAQFKGSNEMMTADSHVTIVRPDDKKIDPFFLGYVMSFKQVEIEKMGVGATGQTELSRNTLKELEIGYPEKIEYQKKIADVLSAYDDLIENNNRRIKILEEMAQLIYKEWFVDFKFPGHEKVKMVEGELGSMPEDWEIKKLGDKINILKGKSITKNTITNGMIPVVAGGISPAYYHNKANTKKPVITISASGANAGFVNLYQEDIWASDCSYIDSIATPFVYFYYLLLTHKQIEIIRMQKGAAQPHVYPKDLMELLIFDIPEKIMLDFKSRVNLIFDEIENLKNRNNNLRRTRDLLLPKLMSGEINL